VTGGGLGGTAVVLPGENGSQPGMVDAWLADAAARSVVEEVSDTVGRDVAAWWRDPDNAPDPVVTQLEVVVTGIAGYRSLTAAGPPPVVVAGHGVGEYAALVAAGALALSQVVELVHWRAELMGLAPRPSCAGLAAVLGPGAGTVACTAVAAADGTGSLAVACLDGPERAVLAGTREDLARARETVLAAGLTMVRLPGRAPCHGPLMARAATHLAPALADLDWSVPSVPVVPNVDASPTRDPDRLARCLRQHLTSTVRWEETSHALVAAGATAVVEVGASPVLGPLVRQALPGVPVHLAAGPGAPLPVDSPEPALAGPATSRGEQ
jgi:[acyl-carrier-protein] S-malonyltransferase